MSDSQPSTNAFDSHALTPALPTDAAFSDWLHTPPGRYLQAWEQAQLDRAVANVFGFHAMQLGMSGLKGLRANRMPHRWLAQDGVNSLVGLPAALHPNEAQPSVSTPSVSTEPATAVESRFVDIRCHFDALPIKSQSLDLVVMPHTLDLARNPHDTLREVDRVLVPDGRIVISGFNSASLWGAAQRAGHVRQRLGSDTATFMPPLHPARQGGPHHSDFIGYRRLRDWLRLLSIDIEGGRFGCYVPPVQSDVWLRRMGWMEKTGDRWWPVFGAVYFIVAVKRVRGMRMVGLAKRDPAKMVKAPAAVAQQVQVATHPTASASTSLRSSAHDPNSHPTHRETSDA
jgi:SAM-dependent methyltransferase